MNSATASATCTVLVALLLVAGIGEALAYSPFEPDGVSTIPLEATRPGSDRFEIEQVDPSTLTCDGIITFEDVAGGPEPGTNYDAIFESDGADFAERFVGQSLSYSGDFDVLSGLPTTPLSLQVGAANENVGIMYYEPWLSQVLYGLGPLGFPNYDAIGEGAFAVLFDYDQSEFGFDLMGGDDGNVYVSFFKRDGSLIDVFTLTNVTAGSYGFRRVGGVNDIAGIAVYNDDPAGVGFDNLCHDIPGQPGAPTTLDIHPTSCPNPLNVKSRGVLPVALTGYQDFDVTTIDPESIELIGVAPLRWAFDDVTEPFVPTEPCECSETWPDGYTDLTVKFATQEIVAALGTFEDGDELALTLTFTLMDGTPYEVEDCVWIRDKTKEPLATALEAPDNPEGELRPAGEERSWGTIKALYR
ncbi:hypothetical protein KAW64_07460 [bacterium]|nr:hypothetical protein [bacterium]